MIDFKKGDAQHLIDVCSVFNQTIIFIFRENVK